MQKLLCNLPIIMAVYQIMGHTKVVKAVENGRNCKPKRVTSNALYRPVLSIMAGLI